MFEISDAPTFKDGLPDSPFFLQETTGTHCSYFLGFVPSYLLVYSMFSAALSVTYNLTRLLW